MTERLKKDIINLVINEVAIEGESVKIFATIPLPNKIHEREMDKTDIPGTFNAEATLGPVNETNMARIWNKHRTNTSLKRKVFVGLSGGVDSSVAAYLLKKQNYDVVGVFIHSYNVDGCAERDARDARRVAAKLNIPFYTFDFEKEYKKEVVEYMVREYRAGRTPNPDVMCNREIKFGLFLKKALRMGADYVATGHYVRLASRRVSRETGRLFAPAAKSDLGSRLADSAAGRNPARRDSETFRSKPAEPLNDLCLLEGMDKNKDQSYFLWTLNQEQLKHCLFPLGDYLKPEVRNIAKRAGLPTAEKKDSQGICFLGEVKLIDFLKQYIPAKEGPIIDTRGRELGRHEGVAFYTVGQRHLGVNLQLTNNDKKKRKKDIDKYYVAAKDAATNILIVAEGGENKELYRKQVKLQDINLINGQLPTDNPRSKNAKGAGVWARVRYRQPLFPAQLILGGGKRLAKLVFERPVKFVASGQSAVFYIRRKGRMEMLGGGVIE